MNPITNKKSTLVIYIAVITILMAIYSCVTTHSFTSIYSILIHTLTLSLFCSLFFLLLWNLYYYAIYKLPFKIIKLILLILIGSIFVSSILYTEYLLFNYLIKGEYPIFSVNIATRALIFALIYFITLLWYTFHIIIIEIDKASTEVMQEDILETLQNTPSNTIIERVNINTPTGTEIIGVNEIISLKANGDYVMISTQNGRWIKEQTMKYFESSLPPKDFVRIHRSHIINIAAISRIERTGEKKMVLLTNGEKLPVSATGDKALRIKLGLKQG